MHRLSRRSVSAILRTGGGARYRNSVSSISSSNLFDDQIGESNAKPRLFSVLTSGTCRNAGSVKLLNRTNEWFLGNRYESSAAASESSDQPAEKYEYQAEVSRLMDLIVNSLYSNKEVFLRELISNASDALDKIRFLSVAQPELAQDGVDLDIRIHTDPANGIVYITDSGIGMTREELVECLGTIAQSGTAKFLKALKDSKDTGSNSNLIGQFGVGFYSAFLVANKVIVSTKSPKSDKQYVWEGEANSSSYTIRQETEAENLIPRGTRLTLFLKSDQKDFAQLDRIENLIQNYSQFVSFPIYTWKEKGFAKEVEVDEDPSEDKKDGENEIVEKPKKTKKVVERYWEWDLANQTEPIWLRNPKEVSTDDYSEFYRNTFNDTYYDPLATSHFTTEGEVEFRSILYVPANAPSDKDEIINKKTKNIRLYVKRVFISDDFDGELFPRYLSFVKGVVDSNDLPLNVSREILQESRTVRTMRKQLVKKTFDMIRDISLREDSRDYEDFWENFGKYLKLGCLEDRENREKIGPLLRFFSSDVTENMTSLDKYIERMKPGQKDIYYIASDSVNSAENTPFLEKLKAQNLEVLYLVESIDEIALQQMKQYKNKNFVDISKDDLDLGDKNEEEEKKMKEEFKETCDWMKNRLTNKGIKIGGVQITNRLTDSPCVLVSNKFGWSANMERLMKGQPGTDPNIVQLHRSSRILEINPDHPIIKTLDAACKTSPYDEEALDAIELLYDGALVSSGFTPEKPVDLGKRIFDMMKMALEDKWAAIPSGSGSFQRQISTETPEAEVAEVVEPVQAGSQN